MSDFLTAPKPIRRVLIANRGEIACRIIATCRRLGLTTIAVASEADARARHVRLADEARVIGPAAAAESYLDIARILAAARDSGADAIHPGYGFLSENPAFVRAVEEAGLIFIGPSSDAVETMGSKITARRVAEQAGVPVVPGFDGQDADDAALAEAAESIGFPVLVKASAGGGGRGMRRVYARGDLSAALASARAEAASAFGDATVFLEKLILAPRHLEVQVFGDGQGGAVHFHERDCSVQRNHQKVIEEAPAPGMTAEMREAMGAAAVRAAEAIGYKGAGTIEFIVDGSQGLRPDGFWFMEMNTRLQVEHPVTEAITGVDLVEWQLRVASGEALPKRQEELTITGHAFEARLYAEDVPAGFLPATGRLSHLSFPAGARADTGVRSGDVISPHYDPMIAKIITHGPTREIALKRLSRGLEETKVAGTVTNLAFLGALADHEGFARGDVDTGLIGRDIDTLAAAPQASPVAIAWAAMVALGLDAAPAELTGFRLWGNMTRRITLRHGGEDLEVVLTSRSGTSLLIELPSGIVVEALFDGIWSLDDQPAPAHHHAGHQVTVFDGYGQGFDLIDPLDRAAEGGAGGNLIEAPMPGLVKSLFATQGQEVTAGMRLAVLEAMKMEHGLLAPRDGVVAEVLVAEGAQVEAGAPLIRLEEEK